MSELTASAESTSEIRVLHVDDDPALTDLVATALERVNDRLAVTTANSVDAALALVRDEPFDCVVSDYEMPGRTGVEFLRTLRETHPHVPFILYTGKGSEEVASDAITAGASDYMQKEAGIDHYGVLANRIVTLVEHDRAEATMNDVQRLFSELADRTTDVLWLFTADWAELVFVNDAYEDVFGQPTDGLDDDAMGFLDAVRERDRPRLEDAMTALSDGVSVDIEVGVETTDEGTRDLWIKGEPITDDAGTVTHVGGFTRDITERKTRERELERYEAYLERSTDIITVLNADGTLKYQSPSVTRTLGYEPGELVGQNGFDIVHPNDRPGLFETFLQLVETPEDSVTAEGRFRTADGEWRWLEVRGRNHLDHPVIEGVITNNRDITERKRRERELARMRGLLEKTEHIADVAGWEVDAETMEVFWTDHLFDLIRADYDDEPTIDEALSIYHEDDRPVVENAIETALADGEPFDVEARFHTPCGELRWLRIQGVPIVEDGAVTTLRGAVQDVTAQKESERELTRQNDRLEEFASVVSHDLRNPLTVADGYLDLARETGDPDALDKVAHAHERMHDLIEDILALARQGDRVDADTPLDLAAVIEDAWRNVPTDGATLDIATTATVYANRGVLQQLLENLFRNAVEHGGDTVTVNAHDATITIADDGPGIPEHERDRVFETGYTTTDTGTGFGLAIASQCADAHGWTIRATESPDGGAQFELTNVHLE
ncbi:hybrid sensor histidine kinase/response regulator [Salarchaeum japonicum]|uniref:histidine kinase n=1 Tax=Salarchaeum japonicum TaxID=555573 RepID=A0AAV3T2R0_9EURY|nr:PAS domain S-box protein [Salarchaeum japonicum]